jgi:hypothetical protein
MPPAFEGGSRQAGHGQGGARHASQSGQQLDSALYALREHVGSFRFALEAPGVDEARAAQKEIIDQLDEHVLPRLERQDAPLLVVAAGSTGAGKSTLVNSLVRERVSQTGVRRPTTSSPVLVCHPVDAAWFDERYVLPGLPRVPEPRGAGDLVVVRSAAVPRGVALLDSPDIDSVFKEHHELAGQLLGAADLCLFVTSATRYADAQVWRLLRRAREHGATLGVVLTRVPWRYDAEIVEDFARMLDEAALGEVQRFMIYEDEVEDGVLPRRAVADVHNWLSAVAAEEDHRVEVVVATLVGMLNSFRTRVPELAKQVEGQLELRARLRGEVEATYATALTEIDETASGGALMKGELLARWQDFAATGDLTKALNARRGRTPRRAGRRPKSSARVGALKVALRHSLEALIVAAANRAAAEAVRRWRADPAGDALLTDRADQLTHCSPELARRANRTISGWQDYVHELVRTEGVTKRSVAKLVSLDEEALALVLMVGLLCPGELTPELEGDDVRDNLFGTGSAGGSGNGSAADNGTAGGDEPAAAGDGIKTLPRRLLRALFGAEPLRGMASKAHADLRSRIGTLFDEEAVRFGETIDAAGVPDESTAIELYQATHQLEVAR